MNFVSSHQIFSVAMQQSHPSVKHWDDTFMFEAKPAIAFNTLPSQNVRTVVRYVLE
ncbi:MULTISPECIES: hypothetical protein [unclassified Wolbachia]|nr:hypothetical protein [Wolbachia endosymbiont (group A) of Lasioglossum morio]MDX5528259.1 hypothetical protein [Wolbachia endosymbiont of Andrena minutula]MEC4734494.1 hypothetical protein [Wolbachia endosymbiont of Halictus tumulorum]